LLYQGKEVKKITLNLIEFFRDALMCSNLHTLDESSLLFDNQEFKEIAEEISNRKAFYIIDLLNKALNDINWSNNPKIHLELAFLKISDNEDNSNSNVLAAIDEIEKRLLELEALKDFLEAEDKQESKEIIQSIISGAPRLEKADQEAINQAVEKVKEIILGGDDNPSLNPSTEEVNEIVTSEEIIEPETKEKALEYEEELSDDFIENESEELFLKIEIEKEKSVEQEEIFTGARIIKEELCDEISNTYDIHFVEEVLNNGDRKDKIYLQNRWNSFPEIEGEEDSKYLASLLETGNVMASSYNKLIISFASTTICNTLMVPSNKEVVMKIINKKFNRIINYMALPTSVFSEISKEFLERYRMGETYIKLSKIVCDGLKDVSKVEHISTPDSKPKVLQDAIDLFGDKVKIKE
ncbi:MAG: hypothetical protein RQ856_01110, partial [Candidatus Izemoplasmatales bacterium]|nr:hypothetical protein [Candidatus Izemoplasmatales bacterium]